MERLPQSLITRRFESLVLYRDDLDRIVELLQQIPATGWRSELELKSREYRLASLDELGDLPADYHSDLDIARGGLTLSIEPQDVSLVATSDEPALRGTFE